MSGFTFTKATKAKSKARLALIGPSGAGKTYTALRIASGFGGRIAVIDTEHGSAAKYSDSFDFDTLDLNHHDPMSYVGAIQAAGEAGYDVLVIDSLSHAWMGKDGALEQVDKAAKRTRGNSYAAWRDVTPKHNALIDAMLASKCHLIVTMRAKTEYATETGKDGKMTVAKIGLAPIQREGLEYEFDVVADMTLDHDLIVSKTRMPMLDGAIINKPGEDLGKRIVDWFQSGVDAPAPAPAFTPAPAPAPAPVAAPVAAPEPVEEPEPAEEEQHFGPQIEAAERPAAIVPILNGIAAAESLHPAHRRNSTAKALLRMAELATSPTDLAIMKGAWEAHKDSLGTRREEVSSTFAKTVEAIRASVATAA